MPYKVGEVNAECLFGKSSPSMKYGHIMSARNAIRMRKRYDDIFDDVGMTLVPAPGTTKIRAILFIAIELSRGGESKQK